MQKSSWVFMVWLCAAVLCAQTVTVRGRVEVAAKENSEEAKPGAAPKARRDKGRPQAIPETVVWLTPAPGSGVQLEPPKPSTKHPKLVQKDKSFQPHVLVIPAGTMVEFPNLDPFFHNVFSLFEGKHFDLGLYEAGTSRTVLFDRPGISYIFCNIHPEMSAVVITLGTPLYKVAAKDGEVNIANVPYGRYLLHVWSEGMGQDEQKPVTREITVGEKATSLGVMRVPEANGQGIAHKNKYGRDYNDPTPDGSASTKQQ